MNVLDLKTIEKDFKKVQKRNRKKGIKISDEPIKFTTIEQPKIEEEVVHRVQVAFFTKQNQYAVPEVPISIPEDSRPLDLDKIIAKMLESSSFDGTPPRFDYLIDGKMLTGKLMHKIDESEVLSREVTIPIEYLEAQPPPEKMDSLKHDDWVSCLHFGRNDLLLTGCYDNTVHIWRPLLPGGDRRAAALSDQPTAHLVKVTDAHRAPIKVVSWLPSAKNRFITGSVDQMVRMWKFDPATNSVTCTHKCEGHKIMVTSLAVGPDAKTFATGDGYGAIKLWTTDDNNLVEEPKNPAKKVKSGGKHPKKKHATSTLAEHSQMVTGLLYSTLSTLVSCSDDNSVRLWDVERQVKMQKYVAPSPCVAMHSSPFTNALLVATTDFRVRLIDARDDGSFDLTRTYEHHKRKASCVQWSPLDSNLFVTGGHDNWVKLWDLRSARAPLYEMKNHEDKVLAVDWSTPKVVFSAGADTNVHMFSMSGKA